MQNNNSSYMQSQQYRNNAKHKKNTKETQIYIGVLVFIIFVIYIFGYIFTRLNKQRISIETAKYGTIELPASYKGVIIRDELVVNAAMTGELVYEYSEMDYVNKGSLIATIKNVDNVATIQEKIAKIDTDILKKQEARLDISFFSSDINFINSKIKKLVNSNIIKFNQDAAINIYLLKQQLQKELDKRNNLLFSDSQSSIVSLIDEKTNYENQLSKNVFIHTAPKSGIISFNLDDFENVFTVAELPNLNAEQTKMNIFNSDNTYQNTIEADKPAFKIITSNDWYLASYIPNSNAEGLNVGEVKDIFISADNFDKVVSMEVFMLSTGLNDTYVVFKATKSMLDFLDVRSVSFEIKDKHFEGIKIPNTAIVEKTMLMIPGNFIVTQSEEEGVIRRGELADEFVPINKKSIDDDSNNFYVFQDMKSLRVGDIIVESNKTDAENYKINEVVTVKGVYVVNSSITEFKGIGEVLVTNGEYSIVSSNSIYDIQIFDRIVSDAKSITDSEMIY